MDRRLNLTVKNFGRVLQNFPKIDDITTAISSYDEICLHRARLPSLNYITNIYLKGSFYYFLIIIDLNGTGLGPAQDVPWSKK